MTGRKPSARVVFSATWQREVMALDSVRDLLIPVTGRILHRAITDAPRRGHNPLSWNSAKKNIDSYIEKDFWGWRSNIIIENDPLVRHTLLQERGFKDPSGRRIKGRRFLKSALLSERVT